MDTVRTPTECKSPEEAFGHLLSVDKPNLDDLKLLALLEAGGKDFYDWMIEVAPNDGVKKLLARNGQEELGHAHRLKRVIKILFDEDYALPEPANNPFCVPPKVKPVVSRDRLNELAQGEIGGERFYERWASNIGNDQAAKLLRLNGKEEARHGARILEAITLLPN